MSELDRVCKEFSLVLSGKKQEAVVDSQYRDLALRGSVQTRKLKILQNKSTRSAYGRKTF